MKYAVIDIGTNAVLLMVADLTDRVEELYDGATITRLGERLKESGELSHQAMARTLRVLREYTEMARKEGADDVICVGTAALREARNAPIFLELVRKELSITIRVLSEYHEAYYTYLSVRHNMEAGRERLVIIDIGGGSTEVIHGNQNTLIDYISLPVGSVKLTEMYVGHDPPSAKEISQIRNHIRSLLTFPFGKGIHSVTGTAGTVTTLGSLFGGFPEWDKRLVHGMRLTRADIDSLISRLLVTSLSERRGMAGMDRERADIICQGGILLQEIMEHLGARELIIDANGVRHGILCEKLSLIERPI